MCVFQQPASRQIPLQDIASHYSEPRLEKQTLHQRIDQLQAKQREVGFDDDDKAGAQALLLKKLHSAPSSFLAERRVCQVAGHENAMRENSGMSSAPVRHQ